MPGVCDIAVSPVRHSEVAKILAPSGMARAHGTPVIAFGCSQVLLVENVVASDVQICTIAQIPG